MHRSGVQIPEPMLVALQLMETDTSGLRGQPHTQTYTHTHNVKITSIFKNKLENQKEALNMKGGKASLGNIRSKTATHSVYSSLEPQASDYYRGLLVPTEN